MSLQVLCVGYPRTGTRSLWKALTILGYNALHHDDERVPLYPPMDFDFRIYDDVDAATEEIWWREVAEAYPEAKILLTIRDQDSWYRSVGHVVNENRTKSPKEIARFDRIQNLLYGCASPVERLYKARHWLHIQSVREWCTAHNRPLLMPAVEWRCLCHFLGKPIPNVPFPWENQCLTPNP